MSNEAATLPDNPAVLKAMIAALQAENAKISATLRAHDQLIQTLRLRIAKLQKQAFGARSEKIEREIEQLELALEDLLVAVAEVDTAPLDEDDTVVVQPSPEKGQSKPRRRPRVSDDTPRERRELDPGNDCPDCGGDLRVVGEDVSELLDMIAAQLKVIHCPAVDCLQSMRGRSRASRNPADAAKRWCRCQLPAVLSRVAWRGPIFWPTFSSRNLMTIFRSTA